MLTTENEIVGNNGIDVTHVLTVHTSTLQQAAAPDVIVPILSVCHRAIFVPYVLNIFKLLGAHQLGTFRFSFTQRPIELDHQGFRQWLVAWLFPSHYLNQCRFIINRSPRTNFNKTYAEFVSKVQVKPSSLKTESCRVALCTKGCGPFN